MFRRKLFSPQFTRNNYFKSFMTRNIFSSTMNNPFHYYNQAKPTTQKFNFSSLSDKSKDTSRWKYQQPRVDLDMVGGSKNILSNLSDVVSFLQNPEEFNKKGLRVPRGIILSGPPGTGKSMMAEAVAGHAGVPIFIISAAEVQSPFVGVAEANLREIFATVKKTDPCVLCIDEIDAIAPIRFTNPDKRGHEVYINGVVDQLLSLLSDNHSNVIIFATTNHYNSIDPAIVRPGRFDRHITMLLPDEKSRANILKVHLKNNKLDDSVSLADIATITPGYSGAKLAALVSEAVLFASKDHSSLLKKLHFDKAMDLIEFGVIGECQLTESQKKEVAIHEIGHALIGYLLGEKLYKVTLLQTGNTVGHNQFKPKEEHNPTKEEVLNKICIALAGRAAEENFGQLQISSKIDLLMAKRLAISLVEEGLGSTLSGQLVESDIEIIMQTQYKRAKKLLNENKKIFQHLVNALIEHIQLYEEDFLNVLAGKEITSKKTSSFSTSSTSALPAKKEYIDPAHKLSSNPHASFNSHSSSSEDKKEKSIPSTIEEVAKAFRINADIIRLIELTSDGGYEIRFKPDCPNHDQVVFIKKELKQHNIDYIYLLNTDYGQPYLYICKTGKNEFLKYVKKQNEASNNARP